MVTVKALAVSAVALAVLGPRAARAQDAPISADDLCAMEPFAGGEPATGMFMIEGGVPYSFANGTCQPFVPSGVDGPWRESLLLAPEANAFASLEACESACGDATADGDGAAIGRQAYYDDYEYDYEEVPIAELPEEVAAAVPPEYTITEAVLYTEYVDEIYFLGAETADGLDLELEVSPDGDVLFKFVEIPADEVPANASDVVDDLGSLAGVDNATLTEAFLLDHEDYADDAYDIYYFVVTDEAGTTYELEVSTEGEVVFGPFPITEYYGYLDYDGDYAPDYAMDSATDTWGLPEAVAAAVQELFAFAPEAQVVDSSVSTNNDVEEFGIEVLVGEDEYFDLKVLENGTIYEADPWPLEALPDAVVAAVTTASPTATITEAEMYTEDGVQVFELEAVRDDGEEVDVEVTADGKILSLG